jgi:transposase-like protein
LVIRDTHSNRKLLYILLRLFISLDNQYLCTFQTISDFFSLNSRQDSNNFFRLFQEAGQDFGAFLTRKRKLSEAISLVETQILKSGDLTITEHHHVFSQEHSEYKMSLTSFTNIIRETDALKMYNKCKNLTDQLKKEAPKVQLPETDVSDFSAKTIDPDISESQANKDDKRKLYDLKRDIPGSQKALLSLLFLASGVSMDMIGLIFGVSKSSIHNWIYELPEMKRMLLNSIKYWSGIICIDEKWIKINGIKHFILSAVDNETGFPLLTKTVCDTKGITWASFMNEFKKIYGIPRLIISDASNSLAAGRNKVFPDTPYQNCWFHKLKNLNKRIYKVKDKKTKKKLLKMSDNMFHDAYPSSRKRTAQRIVDMKVPGVSNYVEKRILGNWKHLNKMLTSNNAERFNRKLDKLFSGHYGLKSVEFVDKLIDGLLLKEAILDQRHLEKGFFTDLDISKACQENINPVQIIAFLNNKLFKRVA